MKNPESWSIITAAIKAKAVWVDTFLEEPTEHQELVIQNNKFNEGFESLSCPWRQV